MNKVVFKNFSKKNKNFKKLKVILNSIINTDSEIIKSLKPNYKYSYKTSLLRKIKKFKNIRIFGIGGSILGSKAIYQFLIDKIKNKILFVDDISDIKLNSKKNFLNLIISKSGNTIETIANINLNIGKKDKNVIITDNNKNILRELSLKLKSNIIDHNNFIGGRYSVLSEVGMLPAELMGFKESRFKQFNNLVKSDRFLNNIVSNVGYILSLLKKKKSNSIILNYDEKADGILKWYQQLVGESLGKKGKGILPIISSMPKDNHSLMQYYLDGQDSNFYTFFFTQEKFKKKIGNRYLDKSQHFLKNKDINQILFAKHKASEKVFKRKKIPFRSFIIKERSPESMGELFCFFIIETILLGKALGVNPYDQPSVELIKIETKKILSNYRIP
jgi:glucose-6-phosphate isomerase